MITLLICLGILAYYKLWTALAIVVVWEIGVFCWLWPKKKKMMDAESEKERIRTKAIRALRDDHLDVKGKLLTLSSAIRIGKEKGQIQEGDVAYVPDNMLNHDFPGHPDAF